MELLHVVLAHVPLELGKQLVFPRQFHQVIFNHLPILVVADGDKLQPGFRILQQRKLVEHAGKSVVKFINLAGRNKEGVRILDFQADGHGHVLGDEDVVVNPGQRNLFVKADPGKLVHSLIAQYHTLTF